LLKKNIPTAGPKKLPSVSTTPPAANTARHDRPPQKSPDRPVKPAAAGKAGTEKPFRYFQGLGRGKR